jgi:hypothetical protein
LDEVPFVGQNLAARVRVDCPQDHIEGGSRRHPQPPGQAVSPPRHLQENPTEKYTIHRIPSDDLADYTYSVPGKITRKPTSFRPELTVFVTQRSRKSLSFRGDGAMCGKPGSTLLLGKSFSVWSGFASRPSWSPPLRRRRSRHPR